MATQQGFGVEEIYRGVISDVVSQVREAFLDEGIDIEVLQQLKKAWETKIQASGAVDLDARPPPPPAQPPPTKQSRHHTTQNTSTQRPSTSDQTPGTSQRPSSSEQVQGTSTTASQQQKTLAVSAQQQQSLPQLPAPLQNPVQLLNLPTQMLNAAVQFPPGILPPGSQCAIIEGPNGPNFVLLNPQMQLSLDSQAQLILQQNAGNPSFRRPVQEIATKKESSNQHIPQLDGGGPGMTDSSSEEEQEDDPLKRYAGLEDETAQQESPAEEEVPLNSDDDQSDDEDLDTLFDADNVVVCQFEKVHRARNKWKFILKDGVMQIKGKDYCFHKSNGEAEW
uniref:Uncharacterized protein n=1 Tax=Meloidogyne enterolobii TaxID=390850 RepID=A0A6V7X7Q7_MELEN|nr:unnamed protein product [Meloidogyne enterolobii]